MFLFQIILNMPKDHKSTVRHRQQTSHKQQITSPSTQTKGEKKKNDSQVKRFLITFSNELFLLFCFDCSYLRLSISWFY